MIEKNDWRLLNNVEYLKKANLYPTNAEAICRNAPHLKRCAFCSEPVRGNPHQWFVTHDLDYCICEECCKDFQEDFDLNILVNCNVEWRATCPKCGEILLKISSQDYIYECSKCRALFSEDLDDVLELN